MPKRKGLKYGRIASADGIKKTLSGFESGKGIITGML